jgi:hypothetical protein
MNNHYYLPAVAAAQRIKQTICLAIIVLFYLFAQNIYQTIDLEPIITTSANSRISKWLNIIVASKQSGGVFLCLSLSFCFWIFSAGKARFSWNYLRNSTPKNKISREPFSIGWRTNHIFRWPNRFCFSVHFCVLAFGQFGKFVLFDIRETRLDIGVVGLV